MWWFSFAIINLIIAGVVCAAMLCLLVLGINLNHKFKLKWIHSAFWVLMMIYFFVIFMAIVSAAVGCIVCFFI